MPKQKPSQNHDANYKLIFSDPVLIQELLEDFAPPEIVATLDFSTLERLPAEYVDERTLQKRADDLVWRVRRKDGTPCYVAILLEFQSRPDPLMALRILVYSGLLLQTLAKTEEVKTHGLPPLLPIVIYNGPGEWNAAEEVAELFVSMVKELEVFNPKQRYLALKVMALSEESLAGRGIAAQVFRFEQQRDAGKLRELVRETLQRFHGEKYTEIQRIIAAWLGGIVAERLPLPPDQIPEIHTLMGVQNMLEYHLDAWEAARVQEGRIQGLAEGLAEGKAEGLAEGKAEGLAEGKAEGLVEGEAQMARHLATDALLARFGVVPDEVRARLESINDPQALRHLAGAAAWQAKSLDDFIALLPDGKSN